MMATLLIQSDWHQALRRDEGEAWLSCRSPGKPTLYGSLTSRRLGTDGVPDIAASEGFVVGEVTKKSILISCPHENVSTKFLAPYTTFCRIHQKSWWRPWCVYQHRWDHEDLAGCKWRDQRILDTAIVDRGRNVLSCSRDGTARLWDCGKAACLGLVANCGAPVNSIAVGTADGSLNLGTPEKAPSEHEVGTEGKLLLLAREDKKLQGVGLQSRQQVFLFTGSDAFNCCTFLSSTYILAGTQDGNIYQLDVRNTNAPIQVIHRSGSPVLSLLPYQDGFVASQGDGTCFIMQQDLDHVLDLTEADCDPVYKVASWEKEIYTCCRDGIVRRYQLADL
ncbi:proteasomal ATPase-associated factor 1 isoform X2 [Melanerpes formicivorus]|uniref:proteasomal ATPase-associated factor 1 isoform X2 n=1 Tax=Melanerpes formicivorus TaxID=211600 RepID=UPI003590221F